MSSRGPSYRTQNSSELYPLEGLVSLYPGDTSVVSGIPYGVSSNRVDLCLERELGTYFLRLSGSEHTPKPFADLASRVLEEKIAEARLHGPRYPTVTDIRAAFLRRYYNTLLERPLAEKTDFPRFTRAGKVYVSFSQFRFA